MAATRPTPFERILKRQIEPLAPAYRVGNRSLIRIDDGLAKCVYFDPSGYAKGWYQMYAVVRPLCIPSSHCMLQFQVHAFGSLPRVEVDITVPGGSADDPGVREIVRRLPKFTAALDRIKGVAGVLKDADLWWGSEKFVQAQLRAYLFAQLGDLAKAKQSIEYVLAVTTAMPPEQHEVYMEDCVLPARELLEAINTGETAVRAYLHGISDENLRKLKLVAQ